MIASLGFGLVSDVCGFSVFWLYKKILVNTFTGQTGNVSNLIQ